MKTRNVAAFATTNTQLPISPLSGSGILLNRGVRAKASKGGAALSVMEAIHALTQSDLRTIAREVFDLPARCASLIMAEGIMLAVMETNTVERLDERTALVWADKLGVVKMAVRWRSGGGEVA